MVGFEIRLRVWLSEERVIGAAEKFIFVIIISN